MPFSHQYVGRVRGDAVYGQGFDGTGFAIWYHVAKAIHDIGMWREWYTSPKDENKYGEEIVSA
jgi:hypothetical protein